MNNFYIFDKTAKEYSLAHTDDRITFCRSKAKVIADHRGQILWTPYLMNYPVLEQSWWNLQELAPSDDLV